MSGTVLIVYAHPAHQTSRVNRRMVDAVRDIAGVTVRDLYELYPDFHIKLKAEQDLLASHDHIVFQHPFFWYSCPSLLKEYIDLTLSYGWAYGPQGTALHGKTLLSAISTGGAAEAYQRSGHNFYTVNELLQPFDQTARLCGMTYLEPFILNGALQTNDHGITLHCEKYRQCILDLSTGKIGEVYKR